MSTNVQLNLQLKRNLEVAREQYAKAHAESKRLVDSIPIDSPGSDAPALIQRAFSAEKEAMRELHEALRRYTDFLSANVTPKDL
jgi:hypothetical protein